MDEEGPMAPNIKRHARFLNARWHGLVVGGRLALARPRQGELVNRCEGDYARCMSPLTTALGHAA
eukprot:4688130-Pyramimonas_sp.AAC.1